MRLTSAACALTAVLLVLPAAPVAAAAVPAVPAAAGKPGKGPHVTAKGALLVDAATGRTLWSRAADTRRPIGSITKVMVAFVVLRAGGLDRKLTVRSSDRAYAASRHGSNAGLRPGDRIAVRDLLNALLLPSGCDAAAALADHYGPGRPAFVRRMNRTARRLGLKNTHYGDIAGLPPAPGYSTPRDLVRLATRAMAYPDFRAIVRRSRYTLPKSATHARYVWRTTDLLLGNYRGLAGVKSGHTNEAGYSFLFAAQRGDRRLLGCVLNSSTSKPLSRFYDTIRLLNWGFRRV